MSNENELKQDWRKAGKEMNSQVYSSATVSSHIETQRKQDRTMKTLLSLLLIFGFVILIAVLRQITT